MDCLDYFDAWYSGRSKSEAFPYAEDDWNLPPLHQRYEKRDQCGTKPRITVVDRVINLTLHLQAPNSPNYYSDHSRL